MLSTGLRYRSAVPDLRAVEVEPITDADIPAVAEFLHFGMGSEVPAADWRRAIPPPWDVEQPNHGYLLRENGRVVGAYLAVYSERMIDGRPRRICNLGTWCVAEEHRASGLRLLRSLLRQRGYTFTDLTPNPNVVALNTRLGFAALDTARALVPNMPWPIRSNGVRVVDTPNEIDGLLSGQDQTIYRDHAATAAHHVVLTKGDRSCYVMFRRDCGRIKRRPLFASILYVGTRCFSGVRAAFLPISAVAARDTCDAGGGQGGWTPSTEVGNGGGSIEDVSQRGSGAGQIDYLYSTDLFQVSRLLALRTVLRPSHDRQHRFTGQFNAR